MPDCELLSKCGFFKKYEASRQAACVGLISQYCRGPRQADCKRKEYRKAHGQPPPDEMLPGGSMLKA